MENLTEVAEYKTTDPELDRKIEVGKQSGKLPIGQHESRILMTEDKKYLFTSSRGIGAITRFKVDQETGLLSDAAVTLTPGDWPRHFEIDPSGKYLFVTQEHAETLEIFAIKETLELVTSLQSQNKPSFVQFFWSTWLHEYNKTMIVLHFPTFCQNHVWFLPFQGSFLFEDALLFCVLKEGFASIWRLHTTKYLAFLLF